MKNNQIKIMNQCFNSNLLCSFDNDIKQSHGQLLFVKKNVLLINITIYYYIQNEVKKFTKNYRVFLIFDLRQ